MQNWNSFCLYFCPKDLIPLEPFHTLLQYDHKLLHILLDFKRKYYGLCQNSPKVWHAFVRIPVYSHTTT